MDVKAIKDSIQPELLAQLNRIKRFLDEGHAAVMVGSGFSKNADMDSSVHMKDWRELIDDIYAEVYGNKPTESDLVLQSPMKIASLLESSCGRDALDDMIRRSLPDDRVRPGKLHDMLMRLNWKDVFTTNYDTLLERAARNTDRYYQVVINKDDLLYQTSPRIIKLHGSFHHQHPFIMSEEDFRTYPEKYPEFVNTVRQALIENLFCLIGFSGDDPNFLNWLGWLRDVMDEKVSPVYCVTWSKKPISQIEINLFRHRKIEFVNLGDIDGLTGFKEAFEFFFCFLAEKQKEDAWEAGPIRNKLYMDYRTDFLTKKMQDIRATYPGWLSLPEGYYHQFEDCKWGLVKIENKDKFEKEELSVQINFLYELDWRLNISLTPKGIPSYISTLKRIVDCSGQLTEEEKAKQFSLAISLLSLYRYQNDIAAFETLSNQIKSRYSEVYSHEYKRFYYEQCLMALWQYDYEKLNFLLDSWTITNDDFEPVLWKSMLLYEVGRSDEAIQILSKAENTISQQIMKDGKPERYTESCLLQIKHSLSYYKTPKMPTFITRRTSVPDEQRYRFDFFEIRDFILSEYNKNKDWADRKESHDFNIGRTNTSWNGGPGFMPNYKYPFRLLLLHEQTGMPLSCSATVFGEMLPAFSEYSFWGASEIVLVSGNEELLKKTITRKMLQFLNSDQSNQLFDNLFNVYWKNRHSQSKRVKDKLFCSVIPFLVRLSVKVSMDRVQELTRLIVNFNETYRKSFLQTLYACLDEASVQDVINAFYQTPVGEWLDIFPDSHLSRLELSDKGIDDTITSLFNEDEHIEFNAYQRLVRYYDQLCDAQKNRIDQAIRKWRNAGDEKISKYESYVYTKYDPSIESVNALQLASRLAREFCDNPFVLRRDSSTIVEVSKDIRTILYMIEYLTNDDKQRIIRHILDVLSKNKDVLKPDDSNDLMGGIRQFSNQMMDLISLFVIQVSNVLSRKELSDTLDVLSEYETYNFHLLNVIIIISRKLELSDQLIERSKDIYEKLMSESNVDAIESLKALTCLKPEEVKEEWLKSMCAYLEYARRSYSKYIVSAFLVMAMNHVLPEKGYAYAIKALEIVQNHFYSYDVLSDEKSDIVYECLQLAGYLYEGRPDLRSCESLKSWKKISEDQETFNDEKRGFEVGMCEAKK